MQLHIFKSGKKLFIIDVQAFVIHQFGMDILIYFLHLPGMRIRRTVSIKNPFCSKIPLSGCLLRFIITSISINGVSFGIYTLKTLIYKIPDKTTLKMLFITAYQIPIIF